MLDTCRTNRIECVKADSDSAVTKTSLSFVFAITAYNNRQTQNLFNHLIDCCLRQYSSWGLWQVFVRYLYASSTCSSASYSFLWVFGDCYNLHYIILLVLCSLHFLVLFWSIDAFVNVLAVIFSITDWVMPRLILYITRSLVHVIIEHDHDHQRRPPVIRQPTLGSCTRPADEFNTF